MTPTARLALLLDSDRRMGVISKPWLTTAPPACPVQSSRYLSVILTLLVSATIAAVSVAGR